MDWDLAMTYLKPLHDYIREQEPDWELFFYTNDAKSDQTMYENGFINTLDDYDIAFVCDELSACPVSQTGKKVCIFHGLASKGQAFSSIRAKDFQEFNGLFAAPSEYYAEKLRGLGVAEEKIFVAGLTKLDGLSRKILFAPTHNPALSGIPVIKERIYEIPNVKIHLHQWTRCNDKPHHQEFMSYYPIQEEREDVLDLIEEADVIIGDFGSMILEAIALGKQAIQVVNPRWKEWYLNMRGISEEEMNSLPEVELPLKYATQVHSFEELQEALGVVANIGKASEVIYNKIKEWKNY